MNWKLLFLLSLLGLAMGLATVSLIGQNVEPIFWLIVFLFCAWMIARNAPGRLFLHGVCLGLLNCVWVTAAHAIFFHTYWDNHPQMAQMSHNMPWPDHPRRGMIIFGPVIGLASGVVIGLLTLLVNLIVRKKPATA
ncbi:hypothetical protein [Dinghuibacter silviterrae]|uniref:Transmembrane protein n=1 Tax=Dinghuibacter silviterrae TaxID=1539049 RepID=A0A4R8DFV8_9BACT|nr:hypothetical protein [Dinghuibacter silviterrae]TDW96124.1 hypothetical protein EDB95_3947 [Dinghuibacter silviterrae]